MCVSGICNLLRPTEINGLDADKLSTQNKTAYIPCGSIKVVFYLLQNKSFSESLSQQIKANQIINKRIFFFFQARDQCKLALVEEEKQGKASSQMRENYLTVYEEGDTKKNTAAD